MKKSRLTKERPISNDLFKIKLGTINKDNPEIIYINGGTFIQPKELKDDYFCDIKTLCKKFRHYIKLELLNNKNFTNDFISNFDIKLSGLKPNKKTYLSFEIHIKQTNPIENIKSIESETVNITTNIINNIVGDLSRLEYDITKNKK